MPGDYEIHVSSQLRDICALVASNTNLYSESTEANTTDAPRSAKDLAASEYAIIYKGI